MGWDGNGNVVRTDGTRSGSDTWAQSDAISRGFYAPDQDNHDNDIAEAIEACLNVNGENAMAADLNMGTNAFYFTSPGGRKIKTATTGRNSTTTYADDPHLAGWSVDENIYYGFQGFLNCDSASGTQNIKFKFTADQTMFVNSLCFDSDEAGFDVLSSSADFHAVPITTSGNIIQIVGFIRCTAAATVDFQWAQVVSGGNDIEIKAGSWIELIRLN